MRHFVYKTTCILNGKYYLGVHSERRVSDGYIGCGVCSDGNAKALKRKGVKSFFVDSVIKYGYKNFKREIVKEFDSISEAYEMEAALLKDVLSIDSLCMNLKEGGYGGVIPSTCKSIEIIDCRTGECKTFKSQADCASFLGLKNISGKKRFLNNAYALKGENTPVSIKRFGEEPVFFHDVYQACVHSGLSVYDVKRLISKERKSCKGWFLSDFDFNSSFYKNAKRIRRSI